MSPLWPSRSHVSHRARQRSYNDAGGGRADPAMGSVVAGGGRQAPPGAWAARAPEVPATADAVRVEAALRCARQSSSKGRHDPLVRSRVGTSNCATPIASPRGRHHPGKPAPRSSAVHLATAPQLLQAKRRGWNSRALKCFGAATPGRGTTSERPPHLGQTTSIGWRTGRATCHVDYTQLRDPCVRTEGVGTAA